MSTPSPVHRHLAGVPRLAYGRRLAGAISAALAGSVSLCAPASGMHATFNPNFLQGPTGRQIDISRFAHGNPVVSGDYRLDVYVNQNWIGREDVRVEERTDAAGVRYCFGRQQLDRIRLDTTQLPDISAVPAGDCIDIVQQVPSAQAMLDLSGLRLDLSIPQAFLQRSRRGYVDPRDWEMGVSAAFVDYNASAFRVSNHARSSIQYYAGINAGINLGSWRLRHNGSYSRTSGSGTRSAHYDVASTYAQRDLTRLRSQLTLGEYHTPAGLFDSVPFVGLQLASDDRMLPDSQRGFAPTIRGVADSNARVTIRQAGSLIHEVSVAPGPFVIDDLYSTGYSGDLEVTVTEADGRSRSFTVPFASVAQLLRPGTSRYSLTAGQYRDSQLRREPRFLQGSYQRGISNHWTGYSGAILAARYQSLQAGLALSTPVGAIAVDATHARATRLAPTHGLGDASGGMSYRVSYSKLLESTRTNFVVAAYRFSSDGYLGFADYARAQSPGSSSPRRQRNRIQATISQPLAAGYGNLFLSGASQNYWQPGSKRDTSYQAGYSNGYRWGSLSLSTSRSRIERGGSDTQYMLSVSLPLGRSSQRPYLSSAVGYSDRGDLNGQLSVSGTRGTSNQLNYNVYGSRSHHRTATGGNIQYRAPSGTLSASHSRGAGYHQTGLGLSGSVVAHPGGVSFSQSQGETRVVLEAKGAEGARLLNSSGGQVDRRGYAMVGSLMPYRRNEVALDPKGIADNVELRLSSQSVAPRYGAVVMLRYPTAIGEPVLLTLRDEQGAALPLGAEVLDADGNSLTLVGQGSRVFFRSATQQGELTVRWGEGYGPQCHVNYNVPLQRQDHETSFIQADASCIRWPAPTPTKTH